VTEDNKPSDNEQHPSEQEQAAEIDEVGESVQREFGDDYADDDENATGGHKKPSIPVRIYRFLLKRRRLRKSVHPGPNWAEATIVILTLGGVTVAAIQAYIYWQQATIMKQSLGQNERSVILAIGQLAIANRNAASAESGGRDTHQLAQQAAIQARAARRAAKAAEDAAVTAKDAVHISERAYVMLATPQINFAAHTFNVNINNVGRIPSGTLDMIVHVVVVNVANPFRLNLLDFQKAPEKHWKPYHFNSVPIGSALFISQFLEKMDEAQIEASQQHVVFIALVSYNDGFEGTPVQEFTTCIDASTIATTKQLTFIPCNENTYLPAVEKVDGYPYNPDK
jgi:hypothetical protein